MNEDLPSTISQQSQVLDIIRTETALSRYPAHNLSTGNISIEIKRKDEKGAINLLWKVSYNSEYGQPGERAYKLDTLIVNRRIDEAQYGGQSIPKTIRLGSLREICAELGLADSGKNKSDIKQALFQNASAFITVKGVRYESKNNSEQTLDAGFTRYSVIFTGESLPNGLKADGVYLILNDVYMEVLNTAKRRPLDYDYLSSLSSGSQRFYEIIGYQILPAVRYHQRAKLAYSEFCLFSTMTRYFDFDHVKKQMWKIHRPHVASAYIAKVQYEPTVDDEGRPDWNMFYTPGERAKFQQLVFSFELPQARKERTRPADKIPLKRVAKAATTSQEQLPILSAPPNTNDQAASLVKTFYRLRFGASHTPTAKEIEQAQAHLASGEEWAKYLVQYAARYGKEQNSFPENFGGTASLAPKIKGEFDAQQQKQEATRLRKARQSHQEAHTAAYHAFLGELLRGRLETTLPEAFAAFSEQDEKTYRFFKHRAEKTDASDRAREDAARFQDEDRRIKRLLDFIEKNPKSGIPGFWQWDQKLNATPFEPEKI